MNLAPGIGPTFYGQLRVDLAKHRAVIEASDLCTLHTAADAGDVRSAETVRSFGCQRVWLGIPANYLSRLDLSRGRAAVLAECDRVAKVALDMGAELLELNGEGASDGKVVGDWTNEPADDRERLRLESLGVAIMERLAEKLAGRCAIGWTSHDGARSFRIPRRLLEHVALHSMQHYPAFAGHTVTQRELERRIAWSRGQWELLVSAGVVSAEVIPGGSRWAYYGQGWGHSVGALVWGLSEHPIARLWACPSSWSPQALEALRLARRLRAEVGHGSSAVERYQAQHRLDPDGIVGRMTLGALVA